MMASVPTMSALVGEPGARGFAAPRRTTPHPFGSMFSLTLQPTRATSGVAPTGHRVRENRAFFRAFGPVLQRLFLGNRLYDSAERAPGGLRARDLTNAHATPGGLVLV